jgi:hypothetical protein
MALAFYVIYVGWPKSIAKGKKQAATKALAIIDNNLKVADCKWNKRIVLADFKIDSSMLGQDGFIFDLSSGIWIDYDTKHIAICYSQKPEPRSFGPIAKTEPDPASNEIFSFSEIRDYELLEGTKVVHSGLAVGYGPIAIGGGGIVNLSDGLSIRIVTDGMRGAKAILLHLIIPRGGLLNSRMAEAVGGKIKQNSSGYQSCLECARAMIDELGNIIQLV